MLPRPKIGVQINTLVPNYFAVILILYYIKSRLRDRVPGSYILNYHSIYHSIYISIYLSIIAADPGAGIGLVYLCGGKLGELSETL